MPSPKSQKLLVIVPVELSTKETVNGQASLVGLSVKPATGAAVSVPFTVLVLLPPLSVVKVTVLVKFPALAGVKRTTRLVAPNSGRLNGVPDTMLNGPALTVATSLVSDAPPWLV